MQIILGGMQVANALTIDMSKARVLDNILRYWVGSVSYMSVKVAIQFSPRSEGGGKRKSYRRISKFDSKRGRCGSRGRGCRRVRGGCSVHHSSSDKHDPGNGWFHGLDCSDFRRHFSGKYFDKSGSDGCLYVFNKCKSDKYT